MSGLYVRITYLRRTCYPEEEWEGVDEEGPGVVGYRCKRLNDRFCFTATDTVPQGFLSNR